MFWSDSADYEYEYIFFNSTGTKLDWIVLIAFVKQLILMNRWNLDFYFKINDAKLIHNFRVFF